MSGRPQQPFEASPFAVLGLASDADEAAIRAAYHALVRDGRADARANAAYAAIRDPARREMTTWTAVGGIDAKLPDAAGPSAIAPSNLDGLIRELAFLSDWELGGEDG